MAGGLLSCHTCGEIFRSKSTHKDHVKRVHQKSVTATFPRDVIKTIDRGIDGKFECFCGKSFLLPRSFREHAKVCDDSTDDIMWNDGTDISMELNDEDMTERENLPTQRLVNDLPFDCIGNSLQKGTDDR